MWHKDPAEALADPRHFLAHVMTYGTVEDLPAVAGCIGDDELREALELAPAGVFDGRSWAYWHLKLGQLPVPALPARRFE